MTRVQSPASVIEILHHFGDVVLEVNRDGYVSEVWIKEGYQATGRALSFKGKYISEIADNPAQLGVEKLIQECVDTRKDKYIEYTTQTNSKPSKYVIRVVALHPDPDKAYVISENLGARYGNDVIEDKWKMALDAAGDGMWDSDMQHQKVYFSDKWHEIFGYNIGEINNNGSSWSALIHPEDLKVANKNMEDYLAGKKPIYQSEFRYRCKDGSYKWILSRGVVVAWTPDGKPLRMIGTHKDINERKLTEEALAVALVNEKELGQLKTKFISLASHEFRTPLSTILSSAYLVSKYLDGSGQPKREKHIQRIVSSVTTLTDILNDFLSVGKIEEGKIVVRVTSFDIKVQTRTIVGEISTILRKGQNILYNHTGDTVVNLDVSLYKHIVINLLSNAIKFSPENASIYISTNVLGDGIELSVKDSGIGISEEDKKHLFERFYRGNNVSNIQGTGLGLHIVSKYAELLNATITCESGINKGTEFIVRFKK